MRHQCACAEEIEKDRYPFCDPLFNISLSFHNIRLWDLIRSAYSRITYILLGWGYNGILKVKKDNYKYTFINLFVTYYIRTSLKFIFKSTYCLTLSLKLCLIIHCMWSTGNLFIIQVIIDRNMARTKKKHLLIFCKIDS